MLLHRSPKSYEILLIHQNSKTQANRELVNLIDWPLRRIIMTGPCKTHSTAVISWGLPVGERSGPLLRSYIWKHDQRWKATALWIFSKPLLQGQKYIRVRPGNMVELSHQACRIHPCGSVSWRNHQHGGTKEQEARTNSSEKYSGKIPMSSLSCSLYGAATKQSRDILAVVE